MTSLYRIVFFIRNKLLGGKIEKDFPIVTGLGSII